MENGGGRSDGLWQVSFFFILLFVELCLSFAYTSKGPHDNYDLDILVGQTINCLSDDIALLVYSEGYREIED